MKYTLKIYKDGKLSNTFESEDTLTVLREFTNCMTCLYRKTGKVRVHRVPYIDKYKITMTWPQCYGVQNGFKYSYEFIGLEEGR